MIFFGIAIGEKCLNELIDIEIFQIIDAFPNSYHTDRKLQFMLQTEDDASFRSSIVLTEHYARKLDSLIKTHSL